MDSGHFIGLPVFADGAPVGRVEDIRQTGDGRLTSFVIRLDAGGERLDLSTDFVRDVTNTGVTIDTSRVSLADLVANSEGSRQPADDATRTLRLHEEVLDATVRPVERGVVRIEKRVETVPFHEDILVEQERVTVERVPIGRFVDQVPQARQEGNTWVIPVLEEVIVTERRLRLVEEVRVTRQRESQVQEIDEQLRREVVEVKEDLDR